MKILIRKLSMSSNFVALVAAVGCFVASLLIAVWGVIARYVIHESLIWGQEAAVYLFIWMTFLGATVVYRERGHPAVLALLHAMPPATQRILLMVAHFVVIALSIVFVVYGAQVVQLVTTQTAQSINMTMAIPYASIPICGTLLIVHALQHIVDDFEDPTQHQAVPAIAEGE